MTTRAEMRTKVRNFLKDTTAKASDAELNDYLQYAIADYSQYFPRALVHQAAPAATITVPSGCVRIDHVEVNGEFWPQANLSAKPKLPTGSVWYMRGSDIALATPPASPVYIHYRGLHEFLPAKPEDIPQPDQGEPEPDPADYAVLTVPMADEELLVLYAAALFHLKVGTMDAKLARFREKGERDDNPLALMHERLMHEYRMRISERIRRGAVTIGRT